MLRGGSGCLGGWTDDEIGMGLVPAANCDTALGGVGLTTGVGVYSREADLEESTVIVFSVGVLLRAERRRLVRTGDVDDDDEGTGFLT